MRAIIEDESAEDGVKLRVSIIIHLTSFNKIKQFYGIIFLNILVVLSKT